MMEVLDANILLSAAAFGPSIWTTLSPTKRLGDLKGWAITCHLLSLAMTLEGTPLGQAGIIQFGASTKKTTTKGMQFTNWERSWRGSPNSIVSRRTSPCESIHGQTKWQSSQQFAVGT